MEKESNMELISLKNVSLDTKIKLLKRFGYTSDGTYIYDSEGNKLIDDYIDDTVKVDNMVILPGSVILDDNFLSIASYLEDCGDVL